MPEITLGRLSKIHAWWAKYALQVSCRGESLAFENFPNLMPMMTLLFGSRLAPMLPLTIRSRLSAMRRYSSALARLMSHLGFLDLNPLL